MLFNSVSFILLHIIVLVAYWSAPRQGLRRLCLSVGSLFFYGWYYWPGLFVLAASILFNYFVAQKIEKRQSREWLTLAVTANLLGLSYFKYSHFLTEVVVDLMRVFGSELVVPVRPQWLPLGISFFTFQIIAYLVDVYRGKVKSEKDFFTFVCFVSFYGQLVAGPIVRSHEFIPQLKVKRTFSWQNLQLGFFYLIAGLMLKTTVADTLAQFVDYGFTHIAEYKTLMAWLTVYAFSFQILCDFWGYSTMAVGLAHMYGIRLPINFNSPYTASSVKDFWRQWHITLSSWLRDYLYIPLGGNRNGPNRNLFITMALGGLWHGAHWKFLIWGSLHGLWLGLERRVTLLPGLSGKYPRLMNGVKAVLVFHGVTLLWVFFRAESFSNAINVFKALLLPPYGIDAKSPDTLVSLLVLFLVFGKWLSRYLIDDRFLKLSLKKQLAFSLALILLVLAYSQARLDFIYFVF